MDAFKRQFQQVDALLIDDIQFFAGKDRTQEEFFHTFNALFDGKQQIILTCDRYPREVEGLEPRLKSRLAWGLSVAIEPPDFETRAADRAVQGARARRDAARGRRVPDRQEDALERARPGGRAQHAGRARQLHRPRRSPPSSRRRRCATCCARSSRRSASPTSRRPWQTTTACRSRTCCRSGGRARWRARARWRWRWPRN